MVKERRELMVIILVDQYNLESLFIQFMGQFQAAETASYDYYPLFIGFRYIKTHSLSVFTSTLKTNGVSDKFLGKEKRGGS